MNFEKGINPFSGLNTLSALVTLRRFLKAGRVRISNGNSEAIISERHCVWEPERSIIPRADGKRTAASI